MVRRSRRLALGIALLVLISAVLGAAALIEAASARADEGAPAEPTVVREVIEKRAECSNTYLLSDGQYLCVSYSSPVNYLAEDGSWQSIDASLLPVAGLDVYATTSTPIEVTIADEAPGQKPVSVSDGEWTVTLNLLGWAEDEKLIVDDAAVFTDVAPATDVAYTVLGNGLKEVISLASPSAPNTFTYRLTHAGLELRQDAEGSWGLYEPGASAPAFTVGAMSACDSSLDAADEPQWCEGAHMTVSPGDGASRITYVVPRTWMDDPARVYPIKIDPDLGNPQALDNYLSEGLSGQSFGSSEDLLCGNMNSSAGKCRSLVRFPQVVDVIPIGSKATSASFRLRQYWQPATHQDGVLVSQLKPGAWWTEGSTYSGANTRIGTSFDYNWPTETVSGTGVWMSISCATVVNDWIVNHRVRGSNDVIEDNGFIVYEPDASGSGYSRKFRAHEYGGTDTAYDPKLEVIYTEPAVSTEPVGSNGVVLKGTPNQAISWTMPTCFTSGRFKVEVVDRYGAPTPLWDNIAADGRSWAYSYDWNVTQVADSNYTARVSYYTTAGQKAKESSSPSFNICDGVTAPSGGQSWQRGSVQTVNWQLTAPSGHFEVWAVNDSLGTSTLLQDNLSPSTQSFSWPVAERAAGGWKVRIVGKDAANSEAFHADSNAFTISELAAPQVTAYELPEFADNAITAVLNQGALNLSATDLWIDSWGPSAALDRHYSSKRTTAGLFATGWRFAFERSLTKPGGGAPSASDAHLYYYDERGELCIFDKSGSVWTAPNGMFAALTQSGGGWALKLFRGDTLSFDASGRLTAETDRNGNAVAYTWDANGRMTRIMGANGTASNGQHIDLTYTSGKVATATYATSAGTRAVNYDAAAGTVTVYPNTLCAHTMTYVYASGRLSQLQAQNYSPAGTSTEQFFYDGSGSLSEVRFPDYATNADAKAQVSYGTSGARSATVYRWGKVSGVSGTQTSQLFTWNASGTTATRSNPKSSGSFRNWVYQYNAANQQISETSPMGDTTSQTYDARGNVKTETDAASVTTTYDYLTNDADPNRDLPLTETVPAPSGAGSGVTTYTYDACGNTTLIVQDIGASSGTAQSQFKSTYEPKTVGGATSHGALTKEEEYVSASEGWTETRYTDFASPNGKPKYKQEVGVVLEEGGAPQTIAIGATFDDFGNQLTSIGPEGNTTQTYTYDIAGNLKTSTTVASSASWYLSPLTASSTLSSVAGNRLTISVFYDVWGRSTESYDTATADTAGTKADWHQATYDVCGRAATTRELRWTSAQPAGQTDSTTSHAYDGLGRAVGSDSSTVANPAARTDYDAAGNVTKSWTEGVAQDSDSTAAVVTYDDANREKTAMAPATTNVAVADYVDGRLDEQTANDSSTLSYDYDNAGNVRSETSSLGAVTTASSNLDGSAATETSPSGLTTTYVYDNLGRQKSAQATGSPASVTTYSDPGWVLSQTDAGLTITATYDVYGRTEASQVGDRPESSSEYDACGRKTGETLPDGTVVTYDYDLFGQVSRETHVRSGVTVHDYRTQYDSLGRPLVKIDVVGNVAIEQETYNYPLNAPHTPTASPAPYTLTQNRAASAQITTSLSEDSSGYESSRASSDAGGNTVTRTVTVRDGAQRWTTASLAGFGGSGALSLQREFRTDNGKLASQSGAGIAGSLTYGYYTLADAAPGNKSVGMLRTEQGTLVLGPAINASYVYGLSGADIGRLTGATLGSDSWGFSYDAPGNLTSETKNGATTTYSYGTNGLSRLQSATTGGQTTSYFWDENLSQPYGWRTSQGPSGTPHQITYGYAGNGELASYSSTASGNAVSASYAYDGGGLRTAYSVTVNGGAQTSTSFTYADDGSLLSLSASQGAASWSVDYLYDEEGVPYAGVYRSSSLSGPVFFATVTNKRGDVLELLDANGNAFAAYRYDPYGVQTGSGNYGTGVWTSTTSLVGTSTLAGQIASRQALRYAGYVYDSETSLYYCQARYYDPQTRQWLTGDPAKDDGEASRYQYCAGSPTQYRDSSGEGQEPAERSANWVGYVQTSTRVRGVSGTFNVKTVEDIKHMNSEWLGLGGARGEGKRAMLVQAGVNMFRRKAWWEWAKDFDVKGQYIYETPKFPVNKFDTCYVEVRNTGKKTTVYEIDYSSGRCLTETARFAPSRSAEWIVERLDGRSWGGFGHVYFRQCQWRDNNGHKHNITHGTWHQVFFADYSSPSGDTLIPSKIAGGRRFSVYRPWK